MVEGEVELGMQSRRYLKMNVKKEDRRKWEGKGASYTLPFHKAMS